MQAGQQPLSIQQPASQLGGARHFLSLGSSALSTGATFHCDC